MPAYNVSFYIADSIQSVVDQTHTNWELLIINDGSTDNTFLIMQQIQQALGSDKVIIAGDNHNQGK